MKNHTSKITSIIILLLSLFVFNSHDASAQDYFPLSVGNYWTYSPSYGAHGDRNDMIIGEETVNGTHTFIWRRQEAPDDNYVEKRWISKNSVDIRFHQIWGNEGLDPAIIIDPPWVFAKITPQVGDTWVQELSDNDGVHYKMTYYVESISDTVTVPAGSFSNCVRIRKHNEITQNFVTRHDYEKTWYAPGVGPIIYREYFDEGYQNVDMNQELIASNLVATEIDPMNWWLISVYEGDLSVEFDLKPSFDEFLTSAVVDGPNGLHYEFDLSNDVIDWLNECSYNVFWNHKFSGIPVVYGQPYYLTLTFGAGYQNQKVFSRSLTEVILPDVPVDGRIAGVNTDGSINFSWTAPDPNLYYQVRIYGPDGDRYFSSPRMKGATSYTAYPYELRCLDTSVTYDWLVRVSDNDWPNESAIKYSTPISLTYTPENLTRIMWGEIMIWNNQLAFGMNVRPGSKDHVTGIWVEDGSNTTIYTFDLSADWYDDSTETRITNGWWHVYGAPAYGDFTIYVQFDDMSIEQNQQTLSNISITPVDVNSMNEIVYDNGDMFFSWDLPGVYGQYYQIRIRMPNDETEFVKEVTGMDSTSVLLEFNDLRALPFGGVYRWFVRAHDQNYTVMKQSAPRYFRYDPFNLKPVSTTHLITVTPNALTLDEPSGSANVTVKLANYPTAPVTVTLNSTNPGECMASLPAIVLDGTNWDTGVTVNIAVEDDNALDGTQITSILTEPAVSGDPLYKDFDPPNIKVTVHDDEVAPFISSVEPAYGTSGQELFITVTGGAFDAATRIYVSDYPDSANEVEFTTSITNRSASKLSAVVPARVAGDYNLRITNAHGDFEVQNALTFTEPAVVETQKRKKAIIVAGGAESEDNDLWTITRKCAVQAYTALLAQSYTADSIFVLSAGELDIDGDGVNDADLPATSQNLAYALDDWAKDPDYPADELILYMTGPGDGDLFYLNQTPGSEDAVSAQTVDQWADQLQAAMTGKFILVYDACMSGRFLPKMAAPAGKERVVITGTRADERAWFLDDGEISFSSYFWRGIANLGEVNQAYQSAFDFIQFAQTPQIDKNGDGIADTGAKRAEMTITVGRGRAVGLQPPAIGTICDPVVLDTGATDSTIWVDTITAESSIGRVWARIIIPSEALAALTKPVLTLPTVKLTESQTAGRFEKDYDQFLYNGEYGVFVYVKDKLDHQSLPRMTAVTQVAGDMQEKEIVLDINGDGPVNLSDIIGILKILAGERNIEYVRFDYPVSTLDANGDKKLNIAEALNILQVLGGLKD